MPTGQRRMQNGTARIPDRGRGEKILLVQTSFLGDAVLTAPLVAALRRLYPEGELTVMCAPRARSVFEGNTDIDHVIVDEKDGPGAGFLGMCRRAEELRKRGFSIAVSPHKSFRTALTLSLARIPCRIGFRESAGWFLYHRRVLRDPRKHDVDRNLSLLEALGINIEGCDRKLKVPEREESRAHVEFLFRSLNIQKGNGRIIFGINGGSVWPTKRWAAESFAELMVRLKERYPCEILLFGGEGDRETVRRIQEVSGNVGIELVGRVSLSDLPCALEWCDLFITNDSGPMHMAVARGVPVVAIFCATTPSLGFFPYSSRSVVVEKSLSCRPCSSHGGLRCPLGTEDCIRLISPEEVFRVIEDVMEKSGRFAAQEESYLPRFIQV